MAATRFPVPWNEIVHGVFKVRSCTFVEDLSKIISYMGYPTPNALFVCMYPVPLFILGPSSGANLSVAAWKNLEKLVHCNGLYPITFRPYVFQPVQDSQQYLLFTANVYIYCCPAHMIGRRYPSQSWDYC